MNENLKEFEAYPGDIYVIKKQNSARIRQMWMIICVIAIIVSICVDIAQLSDIMGQAVHKDELAYPLGTAVAIIYVAISGLSGHLFRMSRTSEGNRELYQKIAIIIIGLVVAFLIVIMLARFYSLTNDHPEMPIYNISTTIIFTIAMFMGAVASWILAYFFKNPLAEELLEQAKENVTQDNQLYNESILSFKKNHLNYDKHNNEIKTTVNGYTNNIENCKYLYWQLLMIIDPGNAQGIMDQA